ncbi:hypothetical protein, partial [Acinetobacter baumannii]|uniref:hypothetical protein n=1 Tax=Acinetobacter baumannii TaxID=470 RepID=UPI001C4539FB
MVRLPALGQRARPEKEQPVGRQRDGAVFHLEQHLFLQQEAVVGPGRDFRDAHARPEARADRHRPHEAQPVEAVVQRMV